MKNVFLFASLSCGVAFSLGCVGEPTSNDGVPLSQIESAAETMAIVNPPQQRLQERDLEIIRFVLVNSGGYPLDRKCFLTTTSHENWSPDGGWDSLSAEFHESPSILKTRLLPADQASLKNGYVIESSSGNPAIMIWVNVKEWISPTEVEVETGSWSGPLDAIGASTVYEKLDGQWKVKKVIRNWVS